jgi:hypothetical protein
MQAINFLNEINEETKNFMTNVSEFMSINYDITNLAHKINAAKYLKLNTLNLKKTSVI